MIYLYCFARPAKALTDAPNPAPGQVRGIDGGDVQMLALPPLERSSPDALVALVGRVPSAPEATAEHLVEHDRVCTTALVRGCDVLPARFGQLFADDGALTSEYLQRGPSLAPLWQRVAHAVEMSLTITTGASGPASDVPQDGPRTTATHPSDTAADASSRLRELEAASTGTGYAYLTSVAGPIRERQRTRERIEPFRVDFRRSAGELIRAETIRSQSVPSVMGLSHLIDRGAIASYERLVGEVAVAHPLIRVLFSGPNAPYSFVSLERGLS